MTAPVATSIPAAALQAEIKRLGVTHVVTVPDTHQRSLLELLFRDPEIRTLTVSTEDEAIGINAGLYMGGAEPMLVIQQLGLFAGTNALRGIAMDMQVPTFILAGMFGRDVSKVPAENRGSAVRLIEPLLDALGVPHYLMESPDDLGMVARAFAESRDRHGPVIVLVGAPTA